MKRSFELKPNACALLVIDMQRYFVDKTSNLYVPSGSDFVSTIRKLIDVFSKHGRPIIFTRHIDSEGSLMCRWWQENIKEGDPMSQIIEGLNTKKGIVLTKHQYDAFFNTELEDNLKQMEVGQVVICGVLTNLCCETTARSAFMRGFEVYFLTDGTATYKKEMHEATLLNLSYGFSILTTVEDVLKTFNQ